MVRWAGRTALTVRGLMLTTFQSETAERKEQFVKIHVDEKVI
jgi:hypothetical protein